MRGSATQRSYKTGDRAGRDDSGLALAVFTADLFATGSDRDHRAAVRAVPRSGLDLAGLAVYGPRNAVDRVVKGARLHP